MLRRLSLAAGLAIALTGPSLAAAPLPDVARGVPIPQDKGYFVEEIAGGIYWVTDGAYTTMFATTGVGVIVVDAPPNMGDKLLRAIAEVTAEPITHVIYTHDHADHIGNAGLYPANVTVIAHAATAAALTQQMRPSRPVPFGVMSGGGPVPMPTVTFEDTYTLTVGTQTLELANRGSDHGDSNIYIYAPQQKVLLKIDIIFPGWTPFVGLALAEDVFGFIEAHDIILGYDFDHLVSGHFGRLATRADVETQKAYVLDIRANAMTALQTVNFFAIGQQTGFENFALLFDTYFDAIAQACADLTIPNWIDRLGGVDVWTVDHCNRMSFALRLDP